MKEPHMTDSSGSLPIYTGVHRTGSTVLEIYTYGPQHSDFVRLEGEAGLAALREKLCCGDLVWGNIIGLDSPETIRAVCEDLGLPSLLTEDVLHVGQRSKMEKTDDLLFATVTMVSHDKAAWQGRGDIDIEHEHLSLVLNKSAVITFQERPGDVFMTVRSRLERVTGKIRGSGSDYLLYSLFDALVDEQLEIVQLVNAEVDACERQLIEESTISLARLYRVRKELLLMRSSSFPLRDMVMSLLSPDFALISDAVRVNLRDVFDHAAHVTDLVTLNREMVNNLYEMHMLDTSNNLNRVMTTLTVFSAVFIPLNFLAGFFGMNFHFFPGLASPYGIPAVIGVCVALSMGMLYFFKSRGWF